MYNPSKNIVQMLPDYFEKSNSNMKDFLETGDVPLLEFKHGWIEYEVLDDTLYIYSAYFKEKETVLWNLLLKEGKKQGCKKVEMITSRDPKAWKKLYNFKLKESKLTLDLDRR